MQPILKEHKKLLELIARGEASKSRGDGFMGTCVNVCHGNIVEQMAVRGGKSTVLNLADRLVEHGLIERTDQSYGMKVTQAGNDYLAGRKNAVVTKQTHPPLNLIGLHHKVVEVSQAHVLSGQYRSAIVDSLIALEEEVRQKAGSQANGKGLMESFFSPSRKIVELSGHPGEQEGYMRLYSGAVSALRNPRSHSTEADKDPQEALEILAFVSFLFRTLDTVHVREDKDR